MLWEQFANQEGLTEHQLEQFKQYAQLLMQWNEKCNLTRIATEQDIVQYHFQDSLRLGEACDLTTIRGFADIGSGGGFPGIPLKIKYPELFVVLVEVVGKKITFLQHVIDVLQLSGIEVSSYDYRTFLRATEFPLDLIGARASLQIPELLRMFKGNCPYREAQLVYWASAQWEPNDDERAFVCKQVSYQVGAKERKLVFFRALQAA